MGIIVRNGISYSNGSKINDNVVDQTTTWSSQKIKNEFDEVKIFKAPNAVIHGNPAISNGQITGFSSTDYLAMPFSFNFNQKSFELRMAFTTGEDVNTIQNIFGSSYCIAAFIQTGKLNFKVSSDGVSWDLINYTSTFDIRPNTTYYVNFSFTGIDYKVSYSLNGTEYIDDASIQGALWPHNGQVYIGVDIDFNNPFKDIINFNNPFKGIINFNKWEIKVGGAIFWEGMDDLGLATRLGTNLDNIDEEGVNKIKKFAAEEIAQFSPMTFRGTLGEGGTITELGEAKLANKGYTYKVITDGTYQDIEAHKGDLFISNGVKWVLVPSGSAEAGSIIVEITKAEYEELTDEEREGIVYFIKDWDMPGGIEVDSELSSSSENPVQNKVIKTEIDKKENSLNKVTSLSSSSTDTQYPSAKVVYDSLNNKVNTTTKATRSSLGLIKVGGGLDVDSNGILSVTGPSKVYGFKINPDESSDAAVTYIEDAVGMTPSKMGASSFDYGSWENIFFMPKPCILNDDGTVQCYLNKNDFTKKEDGTSIDTSSTLNGEVMIEFPIIWYKFVEGTKEGEGYFYCSQTKIDDSYECWCNRDENGNITNHFYMAAYNGYIQNGKMRSVKGMTLTNSNSGKEGNGNSTGQIEVDSTVIHNPSGKHMWYTDVYCDRILINALLVLMGKSLNTQKVFGRGFDSGSQAAKEAYVTGTLDTKGMFWGSTTAGTSAVKVFGIENLWGCVWRRIAGCTQTDGTYKVKLTYGTYDGTSVIGYNSDGTGYLRQGGLSTTNEWAKTMKISDKFGFMPKTVGGADSTYYGDYYYYASGTKYLLAGGRSGASSYCGAFCLDLSAAFSSTYWGIAAALSCKPTV